MYQLTCEQVENIYLLLTDSGSEV